MQQVVQAAGSDELLVCIARLESFNRSVSHDLRGPLAGVIGLAQLAASALQQGDAAHASRLIESVSRQASMLVDTVDGLLALASAREVPLALTQIHLASCADEALELVRVSLAHKIPGAAMPPVHIGPLPSVWADPRLMRQLFANLLCNAVKFSNGADAPRVEVGLEGIQGELCIFVRDNGPGFDGRLADRLFQPFRRLHGPRVPGSGLGLSIVRQIVERHAGRAWIESEPGRGTTVRFTVGLEAPA